MAVVKPFICIRPAKENAAKVAALPYDVYNRKEACAAVAGNPISFLNIDRAETQFPMMWIRMQTVYTKSKRAFRYPDRRRGICYRCRRSLLSV